MPFLIVRRKNEGTDWVTCERRYLLSGSFLDRLVGPDVPSEMIHQLKRVGKIRIVRHECMLEYEFKKRLNYEDYE